MNRRTEAGFTVVEVLVAVTVSTVMILVLSDFLMSNIRTSTLETAQAALLHEVQLSLDSIADDVRLSANADQHNRNPDANAPGGNQFGWQSDADTLVLATAATGTGGNVLFADEANYVTVKDNIVYFVSNKTLYKRVIAADVAGNGSKTSCAIATATCPVDRALMQNVTSFSVVYRDGEDAIVTPTNARSIEITLTADATRYKLTQGVSYTTRMVFRND